MKNLQPPKVMFYLSYLIVITISIFFDKAYLKIMLPITLLFIILDYIKENSRVNIFFVLSIVSLIFSDYFLYVDMIDHFSKICILISTYLICACISLKGYLTQIKLHWSKLISLSLIISLALIVYLVFSISELVLHLLPGSIPFIIMAVVTLLAYVAISYYIYVSDFYASGIKLLISACLFIFIVALTPINELFYPNRAFTVFITTGHIFGLYIFMQFLKKTNPATAPPEIASYI